MNLIEKSIEQKEVFKGKVLRMVTEIVELPNGKEGYREIVKHPGAVAILAINDKGNVILVEQYRRAVDKILFEIPAGKLENAEDIEVAAKRELEEETGYKAKKFTYLGKIYTAPGFTDEVIHIYKAEDLYKGEVNRDEDEFINVIEMSIEDIKKSIKEGNILDSKTISSIMFI